MATATSMSRFNLYVDEKFFTADPSDQSRAEVMSGTLVLGSGQTSGIKDCNLLNGNKKVAQLTIVGLFLFSVLLNIIEMLLISIKLTGYVTQKAKLFDLS